VDLDALMLARIQFGFTISFHIIFPAITIGLASYLAVLEACWLKTGKPVYRELYHYWIKIFAVNFGMGVVSGLVETRRPRTASVLDHYGCVGHPDLVDLDSRLEQLDADTGRL
jgi:hypothetical protein